MYPLGKAVTVTRRRSSWSSFNEELPLHVIANFPVVTLTGHLELASQTMLRVLAGHSGGDIHNRRVACYNQPTDVAYSQLGFM